MLILRKTYERCTRNCYLEKLLEFSTFLASLSTRYFMKINIITLNYAYYKIVRQTRRHAHCMTPILAQNICKMR